MTVMFDLVQHYDKHIIYMILHNFMSLIEIKYNTLKKLKVVISSYIYFLQWFEYIGIGNGKSKNGKTIENLN